MEPPRPKPPPATVTHDEGSGRFEITQEGTTAVLAYRRQPGMMIFVHTEVPPALEGRGLAGQLAATGLALARARGLAVIPLCPYIARYLTRHPDDLDLVPEDYRTQLGP